MSFRKYCIQSWRPSGSNSWYLCLDNFGFLPHCSFQWEREHTSQNLCNFHKATLFRETKWWRIVCWSFIVISKIIQNWDIGSDSEDIPYLQILLGELFLQVLMKVMMNGTRMTNLQFLKILRVVLELLRMLLQNFWLMRLNNL